MAHFWEKCKKVLKKVNLSENLKKKIWGGPVTSILFFAVFSKNAPEYIDPSGHLIIS